VPATSAFVWQNTKTGENPVADADSFANRRSRPKKHRVKRAAIEECANFSASLGCLRKPCGGGLHDCTHRTDCVENNEVTTSNGLATRASSVESVAAEQAQQRALSFIQSLSQHHVTA
jgi:hypothetical protein